MNTTEQQVREAWGVVGVQELAERLSAQLWAKHASKAETDLTIPVRIDAAERIVRNLLTWTTVLRKNSLRCSCYDVGEQNCFRHSRAGRVLYG